MANVGIKLILIIGLCFAGIALVTLLGCETNSSIIKNPKCVAIEYALTEYSKFKPKNNFEYLASVLDTDGDYQDIFATLNKHDIKGVKYDELHFDDGRMVTNDGKKCYFFIHATIIDSGCENFVVHLEYYPYTKPHTVMKAYRVDMFRNKDGWRIASFELSTIE